MIKSNELRIGNIINYIGGENVLVYTITEAVEIEAVSNNRLYEPIPLTPGILEKAGFEQIKKIADLLTIVTGPLQTELIETETTYTVKGYQSWGMKLIATDTYIKHIHQLQNLYFALTGDELNVNL